MPDPKRLSLSRLIQAWTHAPGAWFFDLDGTLIDIADHPDAVRVPKRLLTVLTRLTAAGYPRLAVVSGRALDNLGGLADWPSALALVGNHGGEYAVDGRRWRETLPPVAEQAMNRWRPTLTERIREMPGVFLEDKGLSLTVHVRQAHPTELPRLARLLRELEADSQALTVRKALKAWEIRPREGPTKAQAIHTLLTLWNQTRPGAIFGDDWTDEDGFRAFPNALTVIVGHRRPTEAHYRIASPRVLRAMLEALLAYRYR